MKVLSSFGLSFLTTNIPEGEYIFIHSFDKILPVYSMIIFSTRHVSGTMLGQRVTLANKIHLDPDPFRLLM